MNFSESPEFQKDVKRLRKKWHSIPDDLEAAKKYILPLYVEMATDVMVEEYRRSFFASKKAAILYESEDAEVVKMRLDVEVLGSSNKTRVVFVVVKTESTIIFVEMYSKNEKKREDLKRIKKYLS